MRASGLRTRKVLGGRPHWERSGAICPPPAGKAVVGLMPGVLIALILSGCGGNENLAYVTGKVTLDQQPLPNAFIVFSPMNGGTTSYGRTDAEGLYEMVFSDEEQGAWIGENRVEISTGDVDASGTGGGAREKVPAIYNQNSKLTANVVAGENQFNFDLESNAGRVLQLPAE